MEKEPNHTENEFQSDYNTNNSNVVEAIKSEPSDYDTDGSNVVGKASRLLALYEMVRCVVVNFVGGMYKKIASSDNKNTFYVKLFAILGTFMLYIFDYLSLKVLSTMMFFDVLIKSFKHLSSVQDKYNDNLLVKQWVTYGCVTLIITMFDIITSMVMFQPFKLLVAFCKLFLCYKLAIDKNTSSAILNTSSKFYYVNKRGLDGLHDAGAAAILYVKSMYV